MALILDFKPLKYHLFKRRNNSIVWCKNVITITKNSRTTSPYIRKCAVTDEWLYDSTDRRKYAPNTNSKWFRLCTNGGEHQCSNYSR